MRDDDCCRLQRRSFLTTMAGITTAAAFTATGAGTAHAATTDAYVDPAKPALQRGNMKLDPSRAALVVIDPQVDFMKIWEARCRRSTGGGIRYPVCHRVRVPH